MEPKRTLTMNWDGLDDDDDDGDFFEANNRISAVVPIDLFMSHHCDGLDDDDDDDDDEFEDPRMSFTVSDGAPRVSSVAGPTPPLPPPSNEEFDIWMAAPSSINDRRRKLLHGMGLNSSKELVRLRTRAMSKKSLAGGPPPLPLPLPPKGGGGEEAKEKEKEKEEESKDEEDDDHGSDQTMAHDVVPNFLIRSRSDGDIESFSVETKRRKESLIGEVSKQRLTRTLSTLSPYAGVSTSTLDNQIQLQHNQGNNKRKYGKKAKAKARPKKENNTMVMGGGDQIGAFFLIKNLDTGKEFVVKEFAEDGMWNRLSDLETGRQLTMEEFEKSVGYSPVVKELMRRENGHKHVDRKRSINKLINMSKKRGASFIKKVKGKGGSVQEKEQPPPPLPPAPTPNPEPPKGGGKADIAPQPQQNSEWVKVRTQGKTYKELTALRFCQEIQAHQGSIWSIKFNFDGRYLASAGEDKVIHIWQVQECEVSSLKPPEEAASATPVHPMFSPSPDRKDKPPLAPDTSTLEKKKKGRSGSRRGSSMPDYVQLPETVFTLSSEPFCSFEGHLDDVLDLSWSKTQLHLLSSSTDKTVRLWDLETKACLKLFAHNDYVTCIQFNPVNDEYFISGSLDAKVRVWNVPGRRVVDWTDLHEMVTAACYSPDGEAAAVGSHQGNCRMYSITEGKLSQTIQFDIQNKKKSTPKKITGFEFTADNPNEVLVTSTDSRLRIYDGLDVVQKFKGFRNSNSQSAASFSPDGKYVICGSEDSNVYVWKREEPRNGKTKAMIDTSSYECFPCKDVSVAIPWPGSTKFEPPSINLNAKKNSKEPKKEDVNKTSKKPPLPNHKKSTNNATDKVVNNGNNENPNTSNNHKDDSNENKVESEKGPDSPEKDPAQISRTDSEAFDTTSETFNQSGASGSRTQGWNWFDGGGSHGSDTMQARAWGMVIVTAGIGGEIKAYQNFGVPLKVGRQSFLA